MDHIIKLLKFSSVMAFMTLTIKTCQTQFTITPQDKVISTSSLGYITFSCQNDFASIVSWRVNGASHFDMSITSSSFTIHDSVRLYQLTIPINPRYNRTTVVCLAISNGMLQETPPVSLILQDNAIPLPSGFAQQPGPFGEELVLALGENASFTCQHCSTNDIKWIINGTERRNNRLPSGVSVEYSVQGYCGLQFKLTINIETHNSTNIQCRAAINRTTNQNTTAFLLLVQGQLDPVANLTRQYSQFDSILYTWERPFTLNVTHAEPDIIYCVNIYHSNCYDSLTSPILRVIHDCNVTEEEYSPTNLLNDDQIYKIEVKPKTNLQVALNETEFEVHQDTFVHFDNNAVTFIIDFQGENVELVVQFKIQNIENGVRPSRLALEMTPIDLFGGETFTCLTLSNKSVAFREDYASRFNCSVSLEARRIYSATTFVPTSNCRITNITELSTHLLRNIAVSTTTQPGEIMVSSDFVNSSKTARASGFFAIAYTNNDPNPHFGIATRSPEELQADVRISGLLVSEYRVSLFSIEEDGLPFNRSAATAMYVSNIAASRENRIVEDTSNITVNTSREANCITLKCIFNELDSSASQCVAIVSNKTAITSQYGLLSIGVYNFTRIGNTASGCLPEVNTTAQWLNVFTYRDNMLTGTPKSIIKISNEPGSSKNEDIGLIAVGLTVVVLVLIGTVIVAVIIIKNLHVPDTPNHDGIYLKKITERKISWT